MRGKWLQRVRMIHNYLGVFFAPLLLLFVATGWWQTFVPQDNVPDTWFNTMMSKFSNIHTDDYFEQAGHHNHAAEAFKILVGGMAGALILTILLGLALSCQNRKKAIGTAVVFLLGILVPVLILYFN